MTRVDALRDAVRYARLAAAHRDDGAKRRHALGGVRVALARVLRGESA